MEGSQVSTMNGHIHGNANGTKAQLGLLWSKDQGSQFPFTEIRRACARFSGRLEFRGWQPTRVYLHPDHADLLENPPSDYEPPEGVSVVLDDKVALFYIIVKGEPGTDVIEEEVFDDYGDDFTIDDLPETFKDESSREEEFEDIDEYQ